MFAGSVNVSHQIIDVVFERVATGRSANPWKEDRKTGADVPSPRRGSRAAARTAAAAAAPAAASLHAQDAGGHQLVHLAGNVGVAQVLLRRPRVLLHVLQHLRRQNT